jgi:hypothetical protein
MECLEQKHSELDERGINLFRQSLNREHSDLLERYIRAHLVCRDRSYIYLAEDNGGVGSRPNFDPLNSIKAMEAPSGDDWALPGCWGLFTNPLRWVEVGLPKGSSGPSERAVNVGFCVYTIEFDKVPLAWQLEVIWDGKLRKIDSTFQRFKDYRGYEVVYGGRKSLHFHFVFDLRHWSHDLAFASNSSYQDHWLEDFPDIYLRNAYRNRWEVIAKAFCRCTGIEREADTSLQYWEQSRRVPLSLRLVQKHHPLGLPPGSYVRQYLLTSDVRRNTPRAAKAWLHHPQFRNSSAFRQTQRKSKRDQKATDHTTDQPSAKRITQTGLEGQFDKFLETNLPKLISSPDLRYGGVEFGSQGPKIHFYNDANDVNPSSFIAGDYTSILLQGRHAFGTDTVSLGLSPNQLLRVMADQATASETRSDDLLSGIFEVQVRDRETYREFLSKHIFTAISAAKVVLILGPEGSGKSYAAMANIDCLVPKNEEFWFCDNRSDPVFFSSPSYDQAREKMDAFTRMHPDGPYVPFEYLSLTALYERYCPEDERITEISALNIGLPSWLRAIHDLQHEVFEEMLAHRDELFAIRKSRRIPVLFGTHESVRRHVYVGMTRLFYAESFGERWFEPMTPEDRQRYRNQMRDQTRLAHVIVDEVSPQDLMSVHPSSDVEWARRFLDCCSVPGENKLERYRAFQQFRQKHPRPINTKALPQEDSPLPKPQPPTKPDWMYLQEILEAGYSEEDVVTIGADRLPFDEQNGMYTDCVGETFYARPRGWWNGLHRTTMLTTELVSAGIVEALGQRHVPEENFDSECHDGTDEPAYRVFRFDRPGLLDDVVYVENHSDCKKQTLKSLVQSYCEQFPNSVVISDMLSRHKDLASETLLGPQGPVCRLADKHEEHVPAEVITHLSARGSNRLDERDILAFYTAPSIELFCELAAIDARLETRDTIQLWYADRFNQTSGRNRGFRGQREQAHVAVMSYRLYNWLAPYLIMWSRYTFPRRRCSLTEGSMLQITR